MNGTDPRDDPRLRAGLEHLQRAAHEAIAASRALLDVAEELVDEPGALGDILDLLGGVGGIASRLNGPDRSGVDDVYRGSGGPAGPDDEGDDPPVQRIPVS